MNFGYLLTGVEGRVYKFVCATICGALVSLSLASLIWLVRFMRDVFDWSPSAFWFFLIVPAAMGIFSMCFARFFEGFSSFLISCVRWLLCSAFLGMVMMFIVARIQFVGENGSWHPLVVGGLLSLPLVWGVLGLFWFDHMVSGARLIVDASFGVGSEES